MEDEFARRVQAAGNRLADLLDEALAGDGHESAHPDVIRRLLHELSTGIEELRVAEEELIVQGEQLAATHATVDAERERYGRLFEFAPDGYLETDVLGKILEANTAASRLLDVPVRFLVNKLVASFIDEPDRRRVRRLLAAAKDGSLTGDEVRVRLLPRGAVEPVHVGIKIAVDTDPRDGDLRLRWLVRDLTERLKAEEERRALQGEVDLLVALGDVSRLTAADDPLREVLEGIVRLTCDLVEDGTVSVTVIDPKGRPQTETAADDVAQSLSDLQHREGGPCIDAARQGTFTEALIDEVRERWPALGAAATQAGVTEIVGLPLLVDGRPMGALNVYLTGETTAKTEIHRSLRVLAQQASAAVSNAELYRSASVLSQQLSAALETRVVIEQAKGVLMGLQRIDEDEAFDVLRRASQRTNRKLRDVAAEFLDRALRTTPPKAADADGADVTGVAASEPPA